MKLTTPILLFAAIILASGYSARSEDLPKYVFRLPTMEGMLEYGPSIFNRFSSGKNIESAVISKCFQARPGTHIPAEMISRFYYDHFVSIGLIPWQKEDSLTGRFVVPNVVIKGEAHIFTQGTVAYWIPTNGNFISFNIEQRRDYTIGESDILLSSIISAFEESARDFSFKISQPKNITVGDWPTYYENESFVDQRVLFIQYKTTDNGCMGDDGNYMFRLSVYANSQCAAQYYHNMSVGNQTSQIDTATSKAGLLFPPIVVNNVVIEYTGDLFDEPNPEFTDCVINNLTEMAANKRLQAIGAKARLQPDP